MSAATDGTIFILDSRTRERDIELPAIWTTKGGEYVVARTGNRFEPYRIYHAGTGKLLPTSPSLYSFGTQKINKAFAQWFEERKFFDAEGKAHVSYAAAKREISVWEFTG